MAEIIPIDDRALREQAVRLTEATFLKMKVKPIKSANKVAPIVYSLLIKGVDPKDIEYALLNADVLTENGIGYILSRTNRDGSGQRFPMDPIKPMQWTPPTEEERLRAKEKIAEARRCLRGGVTDG